MGAKQAQETREAIRLRKKGYTFREAAKKAGINESTLYRAFAKLREKK